MHEYLYVFGEGGGGGGEDITYALEPVFLLQP